MKRYYVIEMFQNNLYRTLVYENSSIIPEIVLALPVILNSARAGRGWGGVMIRLERRVYNHHKHEIYYTINNRIEY